MTFCSVLSQLHNRLMYQSTDIRFQWSVPLTSTISQVEFLVPLDCCTSAFDSSSQKFTNVARDSILQDFSIPKSGFFHTQNYHLQDFIILPSIRFFLIYPDFNLPNIPSLTYLVFQLPSIRFSIYLVFHLPSILDLLKFQYYTYTCQVFSYLHT